MGIYVLDNNKNFGVSQQDVELMLAEQQKELGMEVKEIKINFRDFVITFKESSLKKKKGETKKWENNSVNFRELSKVK